MATLFPGVCLPVRETLLNIRRLHMVAERVLNVGSADAEFSNKNQIQELISNCRILGQTLTNALKSAEVNSDICDSEIRAALTANIVILRRLNSLLQVSRKLYEQSIRNITNLTDDDHERIAAGTVMIGNVHHEKVPESVFDKTDKSPAASLNIEQIDGPR